jgi:hypothetical protein
MEEFVIGFRQVGTRSRMVSRQFFSTMLRSASALSIITITSNIRPFDNEQPGDKHYAGARRTFDSTRNAARSATLQVFDARESV